MSHPLFKISITGRARLLKWLIVGVVILVTVFSVTGSPLNTVSAPNGIVSFELAGNIHQAQQIIDGWDTKAMLLAAFGLGIDYLFMLVYSTALALGCLWAGEKLRSNHWPLVSIAVPLAWGQWAAAFADGIENFALMLVLLGPVRAPWPQVAQIFAAIKFVIIFIGLVYIFLAGAVLFSRKVMAGDQKI